MSKSLPLLTVAAAMLAASPAEPEIIPDEQTAREIIREQLDPIREHRPQWQRNVDQPLIRAWKHSQRAQHDRVASLVGTAQLLTHGWLRVEIRYRPAQRDLLYSALIRHGGEIDHDVTRGAWLEARVPIAHIPDIAVLPGIGQIRLARTPQYHGNGTISEAVESGNADLWHDVGLNAAGVHIAVIDSFRDTSGEIGQLQASGDWPPEEQLALMARCGDQFGHPVDGALSDPPPHGNGVLEALYDLAPGADFFAYDPCSTAAIIEAVYEALDEAVDIINLSLSIPGDTPGDGSAPEGSLAEAIEYARDNDVLVLIAAGNDRLNHWGGLFNNPEGSGPEALHHWTDDGQQPWFNFVKVDDSPCIANGTLLEGELHWNDWAEPTSDYDLQLWRFDNASTIVASSGNEQTGEASQQPIESISEIAETESKHAACNEDEAKYAWAIENVDADGSHNFRFWSRNLEHRTFSSTLSTPADSPAAVTVGAIDTDTEHPESVSGQGPILSDGGGIPTDEKQSKPDLASFSGISTTTFPEFRGTSVATAHAAGMAALLTDRHDWPYQTFDTQQMADRMRTISAIGNNDPESVGHHLRAGFGPLRFQIETSLQMKVEPADGRVGHALSPGGTVEVLDSEGLRVISGPSRFIEPVIGQDPSEGQATLEGPGSHPVIDGISKLNGLIIDHGGFGYTLLASSDSNDLQVETGPFDVIEKIFRDRFEP